MLQMLQSGFTPVSYVMFLQETQNHAEANPPSIHSE